MIRTIVAFHTDDAGEWVAELSCFHNQHVRHHPPFQERAWVADPRTRAGHVGTAIECPLCDRAELPDGLTMVGRVGPWDQVSVPRALLRAHRIPDGRWGRLRVHHGALRFRFESDVNAAGSLLIEEGGPQSIPPGAGHHVDLVGPVELEIEFWGRSS